VDEPSTRVALETNHHRITGLLRLPADGYRSRLSDYLNASERAFLALTDVVISPLNGSGAEERRDFVAISLSHVVLAMPLEGE
jgi:hypothetical protein